MRGVLGTPERVDLPSTTEEGTALARRYRRRLWHMMFWGNIVAAFPGILASTVSAGIDPDPAHAGQHLAIFFAILPAWIGIFGGGVVLTIRRQCRPITDWLADARAAAANDTLAVAALPRRLAFWSVYWWAALVVWQIPLNFAIYHDPRVRLLSSVQTVVGVVTGGTTGAILTYLLSERALRPLTGLAAQGSLPHPSRVGVLQRLLMAFVAGVFAPLVGFGVALVGLNARQREDAFPYIWVTIAGVIVAGFVVALVTARVLTDPLDEVRTGFRRLKEGDLDVEIIVNEPGEIGQLQAGFNDMVAGLKDRDRVREVFVRFVGKEVAEHALAQGSTLDGEMREATAMFVDVVGSTSLGQRNTEYDYWMQLNSFFEVVVRCVEASGGFVNKFEGDGALCVFGAPLPAEDHAARALGAARVLRGDLDRFAGTSGIEAVIGLSTGNVVAGYVGTANRYEFTVIGDAVNEAKRLAEEAKRTDSKILVGEATIRAAEGEVAHWREAGSTHLRGRSDPTIAFQPRVESRVRLEDPTP